MKIFKFLRKGVPPELFPVPSHPFSYVYEKYQHSLKCVPSVTFVAPEQTTKMPESIAQSSPDAEITILVGHMQYKCDLQAFRVYSKLFDDAVSPGDILSLPEEKISTKWFEVVYAWMTHNVIHCECSQILDLLEASEYLKCLELIHSIIDCLNDHNIFFDLIAFDCYKAAMHKRMYVLAAQMLSRVGKCFLILVGTMDFREMSDSHCCLLLGLDALAVHSEIEVSRLSTGMSYVPTPFYFLLDFLCSLHLVISQL